MFKKIIFLAFLLFFSFYFIHPVKAAYHDLSINNITTNPSPLVFNELNQVIVTVSYLGDEDLFDTTGIQDYDYDFKNFSLSKVELPTIDSSHPLKNEDEFKIIFYGTFSKKGLTSLSFNINNEKALSENSLSNNDFRVSYNVVPPDDLSVDSIGVYPSNSAVGQDATINIQVSNKGYKNLSSGIGFQNFKYNFENFIISDKEIPIISSTNHLDSEEAFNFIFNGHFSSAGSKTLNFSINTENRLDEYNFSNNFKEINYEVGSLNSLDLEVSKLEANVDLGELIDGDSISITATVVNKSDFSISSDDGFLERDYHFAKGGDYEFLFDNFILESSSHSDYPQAENTFDPGDSFIYTFNGRIKGVGSGLVSFKIDKRNKLKEIDENNNFLSVPYIIYSSPEERDNFGFLNNEFRFVSSTSLKIIWQTDKKTDGYVMLKDDKHNLFDRWLLASGLEEWPRSENKKEHSIRLDNLNPGQKYKYMIIGNKNDVELKTSLKEFTMPLKEDFKITKNPQFNISKNSDDSYKLIIEWSTDWMTKSSVFYKLKTKETYNENQTDILSYKHQIILDNMKEGEYNYYISSIIESGLEKKSEVESFSLKNANINISQEKEVKVTEEKTMTEKEKNETKTTNNSSNLEIRNKEMYKKLKGKIILKVEENGEAYYINPEKETIHYLGRPKDAFQIMREQGIGIRNEDLHRIPIGVGSVSGEDSDGDGLSDLMESSLGLNSNNSDSDGDGYSDKDELLSGFSPWEKGIKLNFNFDFSKKQNGKIFLQVENNGEAWYINPEDSKRYFLGRPSDAFNIMRNLGLGISNNNFDNL